MSQEVSKWLVNEPKPAYEWGYIDVYWGYNPCNHLDTNFLRHPSKWCYSKKDPNLITVTSGPDIMRSWEGKKNV